MLLTHVAIIMQLVDIGSATTILTTTKEPFPIMVIGIGLISMIILSIIIVITVMVIWRRPHNEDEENNRSSTISTKPVKWLT